MKVMELFLIGESSVTVGLATIDEIAIEETWTHGRINNATFHGYSSNSFFIKLIVNNSVEIIESVSDKLVLQLGKIGFLGWQNTHLLSKSWGENSDIHIAFVNHDSGSWS